MLLCAQLVEVVMDLGRPPLARFPHGDVQLSGAAVTSEDLDQAVEQVMLAALQPPVRQSVTLPATEVTTFLRCLFQKNMDEMPGRLCTAGWGLFG